MSELINTDYSVESKDVNKETAEDGTQTVPLYNAAHGKTGRSGGPYLDDVERRQAEEWRAIKEDREPDYKNPPATAGTVLVTKSQLVERGTDMNHVAANVEVTVEPVDSIQVSVAEVEPDPTQPDFDNDMSRVAALEASQRLDQLKANAVVSEEDNV